MGTVNTKVSRAPGSLDASEVAVVRGMVSGYWNAKVKLSLIGRRPLTMSSIGNSIMAASMPWWRHTCMQSGGLFVPMDYGHGVAGNTSAQMLARWTDVPAAADLVVIMECTNDADSYVSSMGHYNTMKTLCLNYLNRGQVPVLCFPPPRSDNLVAGDANTTFKFGMIDFFLATELGIPFMFPWRQFVTADATGAETSAMGASDHKHPGNAAHVLAGTAMLQQLTGQDHTIPLPPSSNTYGIGLLADALTLSGTGGWSLNAGGDNGAMSTLADSYAIGNWLRITSSANASYRVQLGGGYSGLQTGDELFIAYKLRTTGAWASGYCQMTSMQVPSFGNDFGGKSYVTSAISPGIVVGAPTTGVTNPVVSGTTQILLLAEMNAPAGYTMDIAQCQVWNKTACFR